MKLRLPVAGEAELFVSHSKFRHPVMGEVRRGTSVALKANGTEYFGLSLCHPKDNFCKEAGRGAALSAMFEHSDMQAVPLAYEDRAFLGRYLFKSFDRKVRKQEDAQTLQVS
jgi:hypothetical protein